MDRRTFMSATAAAAANSLLAGTAHAQPAPKAKNVVLVHGLFADGSCWSEDVGAKVSLDVDAASGVSINAEPSKCERI